MRKDGSPDLKSTAHHADGLIAGGVANIVFLGSPGESQKLSAREKRLAIRGMAGMVKGRVKVIGMIHDPTANAPQAQKRR